MFTKNSFIRRNIQQMEGYTPGEQPNDPSVIKLNTNENPYPPSPRVREALIAESDASWRLYPDPLCQALRATIAGLHQCNCEQIFVGNGLDEVLELSTRAFVEDRGLIGFFSPSYSLYQVLAQIRGVETAPITLNENFDWPASASSPADLFWITNPNAPSGRLYEPDKVATFCKQAKGVVVIDEAYADFSRTNCLHLALTLPNVLVLRSFSKSYSLAGLRVGYAIGPAELIQAFYKIKDSYNMNRLAQAAARAALLDQAYVLANVEKIKVARQKLTKALTDLNFKVWPSEANFLWVQPPAPGAAKLYQSLKEKGVLVRYFPGKQTGLNLRITVGTEAENNQFLARLAKLL